MAQLDHLYYDVELTNQNTFGAIRCEYIENKRQNIIENVQNYCVSLIAARVPATFIPYFLWEEDKYVVRLSTTLDGGHTSDLIPVEAPIPLTYGTSSETQNAINTYEQFLTPLNNAIYDAYLDLTGKSASFAALVDGSTPFFRYDYDSQRFVLYIPNSYIVDDDYDIDTNWIAQLEVNEPIYDLFHGMYAAADVGTVVSGGNTYLMYRFLYNAIYFPAGSGGDWDVYAIGEVPYTGIEQACSSESYWNRVKKLLFITNRIPIANEQFSGYNANGDPIYYNVLAEIDIPQQNTCEADIVFTPYAEFRRVSMNLPVNGPSTDLKSIDLSVILLDETGRPFNLYIRPGSSFYAKLCFESLQKLEEKDNEQIFERMSLNPSKIKDKLNYAKL